MSLYLSDVREWLKGYGIAENYYIGKLDAKKDKSIGVYNRKRSGAPVTAIGSNSSYDIKAVSLLLHWSNNAAESEQAALKLWESIKAETQLTINKTKICYIAAQMPEPVSVGTDDKGIYEYVIDYDLYYKRSE